MFYAPPNFMNYSDAYNGYRIIETPQKDKTNADIILKMYEERLDAYQNNILVPGQVALSKVIPEEQRLNIDDVQFLKQVTTIKSKIHFMYEKYKEMTAKAQYLKKQKEKIEELKQTLIETNKTYEVVVKNIIREETIPDRLLNYDMKELPNPQIPILDQLIQDCHLKHENLLHEMCLVMDEIVMTKKILGNQESYDKIEGSSEGTVCTICSERKIEICMVPCGHCFCSQCSGTSSCHYCRTTIDKRVKLYLV